MKLPFYITLAITFCLSLVASIVLATEQPKIYELFFWPKQDVAVESDSRVVKLSDHPCGVIAIARVTKIPSLENDLTLEPERVVEFSSEGKVLQRWSIPVDTTPIGVRENWLLVEIFQTDMFRLWIDIDGNIAPIDEQIATSLPDRSQCQNLAAEFGESDYAGCWQYRDLDSNQPRILAFEGICT